MSIDAGNKLDNQLCDRVARSPHRSAEESLHKSNERAADYRAEIRAAIEEGTAQARRRELSDGEAFLDDLEADLAQREREQ